MKIYLNKNSENNVCLPLTCNVSVTGTPIYFLFRLINSQTHEETLFTGENLSNNTPRYDKFNWIETGSTANYTASTFSIHPGVYDYEVYQMFSPTNLSLTGVTGGYIMNGICQVSGSTLTNGQNYVYTGQNQNRTVYYRQ